MSEKKQPGGATGKGWQKGQSGNPGGRSKELSTRIREQYKDDVIAIFEVMRDLALGRSPKGYGEIKTSDRTKAADIVLDRALGKAPQQIDGDLNIGITPQQVAVLAAIQLTPHERRKRLDAIAQEDEQAIAEFEASDQAQDFDHVDSDAPGADEE